jgi:hypothetical protein
LENFLSFSLLGICKDFQQTMMIPTPAGGIWSVGQLWNIAGHKRRNQKLTVIKTGLTKACDQQQWWF